MRYKKRYINKFLIFFFAFSMIISSIVIPNIDVFAAPHIHSTDCYPEGATEHKHSGNSNTYGGCYTKKSGVHDCGGYIKWKSTDVSNVECPQCGKEVRKTNYEGTSDKCGQQFYCVIYDRCASCNYKVTQIDKDAKVTYPSGECKYQTSASVHYELNCNKVEGVFYDAKGNQVNYLCNNVVVEIVPVSPEQEGMFPNFQLKATYLDGHTQYIEASFSFT